MKALLLAKPSYAWNIFATLQHEMGPQGPAKWNAQSIRQNYFSFT